MRALAALVGPLVVADVLAVLLLGTLALVQVVTGGTPAVAFLADALCYSVGVLTVLALAAIVGVALARR